MRYSKAQVNEILDRVLEAIKKTELGIENNHKFLKEFELIKEEFMVVDRRVRELDQYESEIIKDFTHYLLSYKEIMKKYHCSYAKLVELLMDCAESDPRVANEMEIRAKDY